jgi:hypothetical protein
LLAHFNWANVSAANHWGVDMARVLVLTFIVITLSCAQAFAQSCAPNKEEIISGISRKLDTIGENLLRWHDTNRNHIDEDRVDYLQSQIDKASVTIDHITDLLFVNDMVKEGGVVRYANGKIGNLRRVLERNSQVINSWLTRITHPYVIAEGREARATIDQITSILAACQPLSRR